MNKELEWREEFDTVCAKIGARHLALRRKQKPCEELIEKAMLTDDELAFSFTGWANVTLEQRRQIAEMAVLKAIPIIAEEILDYLGNNIVKYVDRYDNLLHSMRAISLRGSGLYFDIDGFSKALKAHYLGEKK